MAYYTVEGAKFLFSTTFGPVVNVTAATNGDPVQLSAAAHGFLAKDELLYTTGWEDATDSVWQASDIAAGTLKLAGLDTSDTRWYTPGAGTGTLRKVSAWTEIGQVLDVTDSGGGKKEMEIAPLALRKSIKRVTGFEGSSIDLTIGYDPNMISQQQLNKISRNLSQKVAFKFLLDGGANGLGYGTLTMSPMPKMAKGSPLTVQCSLSIDGMMAGYVN